MDTSKPVTHARIIAATVAELNTLATRHLLSLYQDARFGCDAYYRDCGGECDTCIEKGLVREKLKPIIDTREHVPNKLETKRQRQLAAKRKT